VIIAGTRVVGKGVREELGMERLEMEWLLVRGGRGVNRTRDGGWDAARSDEARRADIDEASHEFAVEYKRKRGEGEGRAGARVGARRKPARRRRTREALSPSRNIDRIPRGPMHMIRNFVGIVRKSFIQSLALSR
jgi:hypothetical protein